MTNRKLNKLEEIQKRLESKYIVNTKSELEVALETFKTVQVQTGCGGCSGTQIDCLWTG